MMLRNMKGQSDKIWKLIQVFQGKVKNSFYSFLLFPLFHANWCCICQGESDGEDDDDMDDDALSDWNLSELFVVK